MKVKQLERIMRDCAKNEPPTLPVLVYIPSKDEYFDIKGVSFLYDTNVINTSGTELSDVVVLTIDE